MNIMLTDIEARIEHFKGRIETEKAWCEHLFEYATIRLLSHKYCYYVLDKTYIDDIAYDIEEKSWHVMGRALGVLKEGDHSPCVGFDHSHPLAAKGIELCLKLVKR